MRITINGQAKQIPAAANLNDVIGQFCKDERSSRRVVSEVNGAIIKSDRWGDTPVKDGDTIELVTLGGGG